MKKYIYLILLILFGCSNEETIKETDSLIKEVRKVLDSKENKQNAEFWQKAYLTVNISLENYKKADPEAIQVAKEAKELFEQLYDFRKIHDVSVENVFNTLSYMVNSVTGKGATITDLTKETNAQQKQLVENFTKLRLHLDQLDTKLCNKYQLNCKAKTPEKTEQKKENKSN